jgi:hypothetical protein
LHDIDEGGLYGTNFILGGLEKDPSAKTTLVDFIRQAQFFSRSNIDHFYRELLSELTDVVDFVGYDKEEEAIEFLWDICRRHGQQIVQALKRMRDYHEDPIEPIPDNSVFQIVSQREFLRDPVERLAHDISQRLSRSIPLAFRSRLPNREDELNDHINAVLNAEAHVFAKEHPGTSFALANVIPDHTWHEHELLIEAKYARGSTTISKITDGISADIVKYPEDCYVIFVVFDPSRLIHDDDKFQNDLEKRANRCCKVVVVR